MNTCCCVSDLGPELNRIACPVHSDEGLAADAARYRKIRYARKFVGMLETVTMHVDTDAEYDEAVDRMPEPRS